MIQQRMSLSSKKHFNTRNSFKRYSTFVAAVLMIFCLAFLPIFERVSALTFSNPKNLELKNEEYNDDVIIEDVEGSQFIITDCTFKKSLTIRRIISGEYSGGKVAPSATLRIVSTTITEAFIVSDVELFNTNFTFHRLQLLKYFFVSKVNLQRSSTLILSESTMPENVLATKRVMFEDMVLNESSRILLSGNTVTPSGSGSIFAIDVDKTILANFSHFFILNNTVDCRTNQNPCDNGKDGPGIKVTIGYRGEDPASNGLTIVNNYIYTTLTSPSPLLFRIAITESTTVLPRLQVRNNTLQGDIVSEWGTTLAPGTLLALQKPELWKTGYFGSNGIFKLAMRQGTVIIHVSTNDGFSMESTRFENMSILITQKCNFRSNLIFVTSNFYSSNVKFISDLPSLRIEGSSLVNSSIAFVDITVTMHIQLYGVTMSEGSTFVVNSSRFPLLARSSSRIDFSNVLLNSSSFVIFNNTMVPPASSGAAAIRSRGSFSLVGGSTFTAMKNVIDCRLEKCGGESDGSAIYIKFDCIGPPHVNRFTVVSNFIYVTAQPHLVIHWLIKESASSLPIITVRNNTMTDGTIGEWLVSFSGGPFVLASMHSSPGTLGTDEIRDISLKGGKLDVTVTFNNRLSCVACYFENVMFVLKDSVFSSVQFQRTHFYNSTVIFATDLPSLTFFGAGEQADIVHSRLLIKDVFVNGEIGMHRIIMNHSVILISNVHIAMKVDVKRLTMVSSAFIVNSTYFSKHRQSPARINMAILLLRDLSQVIFFNNTIVPSASSGMWTVRFLDATFSNQSKLCFTANVIDCRPTSCDTQNDGSGLEAVVGYDGASPESNVVTIANNTIYTIARPQLTVKILVKEPTRTLPMMIVSNNWIQDEFSGFWYFSFSGGVLIQPAVDREESCFGNSAIRNLNFSQGQVTFASSTNDDLLVWATSFHDNCTFIFKDSRFLGKLEFQEVYFAQSTLLLSTNLPNFKVFKSNFVDSNLLLMNSNISQDVSVEYSNLVHSSIIINASNFLKTHYSGHRIFLKIVYLNDSSQVIVANSNITPPGWGHLYGIEMEFITFVSQSHVCILHNTIDCRMEGCDTHSDGEGISLSDISSVGDSSSSGFTIVFNKIWSFTSNSLFFEKGLSNQVAFNLWNNTIQDHLNTSLVLSEEDMDALLASTCSSERLASNPMVQELFFSGKKSVEWRDSFDVEQTSSRVAECTVDRFDWLSSSNGAVVPVSSADSKTKTLLTQQDLASASRTILQLQRNSKTEEVNEVEISETLRSHPAHSPTIAQVSSTSSLQSPTRTSSQRSVVSTTLPFSTEPLSTASPANTTVPASPSNHTSKEKVTKEVAAMVSIASSTSVVSAVFSNPQLSTQATRIGMVSSIVSCRQQDWNDPDFLQFLIPIEVSFGSTPSKTALWTGGVLTASCQLIIFPIFVFGLCFFAQRSSQQGSEKDNSGEIKKPILPQLLEIAAGIEGTFFGYLLPSIVEGFITVIRHSTNSGEKILMSISTFFSIAIFLFFTDRVARVYKTEVLHEQTEDPVTKTTKWKYSNTHESEDTSSLFVERYGPYFDRSSRPQQWWIRVTYFLDVAVSCLIGAVIALRAKSYCLVIGIIVAIIFGLYLTYLLFIRPIGYKIDYFFMVVVAAMMLGQCILSIVIVAADSDPSAAMLNAYNWVTAILSVVFFLQLLITVYWRFAVQHRRKVFEREQQLNSGMLSVPLVDDGNKDKSNVEEGTGSVIVDTLLVGVAGGSKEGDEEMVGNPLCQT